MDDNRKVNPRANDKVGFLVMTRRPGNGVMIGDQIHIVVTKIYRGQVRLAIYAPRDLKITKTEMAGKDDE